MFQASNSEQSYPVKHMSYPNQSASSPNQNFQIPKNSTFTNESISKKLQKTYKPYESIDLAEDDNPKLTYDFTPKPKPPTIDDLDFDSIMSEHSVSHLKQNSSPPKPSISEKFGKFKKPFPSLLFRKSEKSETKQINELIQWKKGLDAQNMPAKRFSKTSEENIIKKPKNEEIPAKKEKTEEKKTFDAVEFVRIQEENDQIEKKKKQVQQEIIEKNKKEKEYRDKMNQMVFQERQETEEERLKREFDWRKNNQDNTDDFFEYILQINLHKKNSGVATREIPAKFKNGGEYLNSFQNCFFDEVYSEILSAINQRDMSDYHQIRLDLFQEKERFTYFSFTEPKGCFNFTNQLSSDDLVLLIPQSKPVSAFTKPFKNWSQEVSYLLVYAEKPVVDKKIMLKIRNPDYVNFEPFTLSYAIILNSCTTMLREFKMIRKIEFFKLTEYIYNPIKLPFVFKNHTLDDQKHILGKIYNESQIDAIVKMSCLNTGIGLIQGPPGTGKTHVIRGILSVLMSNVSKRILVCAPSNIAIDEIANRVVVEKLFNSCGKPNEAVNLLRIGKKNRYFDIRIKKKDLKEMPPAVKTISLEQKVKNVLNLPDFVNESQEFKELQSRLEKVKDMIEKYKRERKTAKVVELQEQYSKMQKDLFKERFSNIKNQKDKILVAEKRIIGQANIIFTTLSVAGSKELDFLADNIDYVIIDEACQSVELSSLIPFRFDPKVVIMVGDPNQLPATYFSQRSRITQYSRSLFERLMISGCAYEMLSLQYRMSPEICSFPSTNFYNSQLKPDISLKSRTDPSWLKAKGPYIFDLETSQESRSQSETSICNENECKFIIDLFEHLKYFHGVGLNIGILSPYKKQISTIKNLLSQKFDSWALDLEVNTIDGFQGREKDVIIVSTVRSGDSLGFLADVRRMNVALTRAKFALWVVGCVKCLKVNLDWNKFVQSCEEQGKVKKCKEFCEVAEVFTPNSTMHTPSSVLSKKNYCGLANESKPAWKKNASKQSKSFEKPVRVQNRKKAYVKNFEKNVSKGKNQVNLYHDIINR